MEDKVILLVEDNPDDEQLTLRALKKNNIKNEVVVARDGAAALDYLFGTGEHAGRNPRQEEDDGAAQHDGQGDRDGLRHHRCHRDRTTARTRWPRRNASATTYRPRNPFAPVIRRRS